MIKIAYFRERVIKLSFKYFHQKILIFVTLQFVLFVQFYELAHPIIFLRVSRGKLAVMRATLFNVIYRMLKIRVYGPIHLRLLVWRDVSGREWMFQSKTRSVLYVTVTLCRVHVVHEFTRTNNDRRYYMDSLGSSTGRLIIAECVYFLLQLQWKMLGGHRTQRSPGKCFSLGLKFSCETKESIFKANSVLLLKNNNWESICSFSKKEKRKTRVMCFLQFFKVYHCIWVVTQDSIYSF